MTVATDILSLIPWAIVFFVPGFLWLEVECKFAPRACLLATDRYFWYGTYTLVFLVGFFGMTNAGELFARDGEYRASVAILEFAKVFWIPVVGGVLTGLVRQKDIVTTFLRRFGVSTVRSVGTGWELIFSGDGSRYVHIVLNDGSSLYGIMGRWSNASVHDQNRDLFIEKSVMVRDDGRLWPKLGTRGVWVGQSEIKYIEAFDADEVNRHGKRQNDTTRGIVEPKPIIASQCGGEGRSTQPAGVHANGTSGKSGQYTSSGEHRQQ